MATLGAWTIAVAWAHRTAIAAFGLRRVPDLLRSGADRAPTGEPRVTVIVPARNEEASVERCLRSLIEQDYAPLHIIAVDDRSTDATGAILDVLAAEHPARLTALHVRELPTGWLGKTHAMMWATRQDELLRSSQAPSAAESRPDWLLFTDADVLFAPAAIRLALAEAVESRADHLVVPPTPILVGAGETAMMGVFQLMGSWGIRLWRIPDPRARRDVLGIGAFGLVKTSAYRQVGGFEALRLAVLEDLSLARRIKAAGLQSRAAFGLGLIRLRWAEGATGMVRVVTKNFFAVFAFQPLLLLAGCGGIALLTIAPIVGLAFHSTRLPATLALASVAGMYGLMTRYNGLPRWSVLVYPVGVVLMIYSLVRSMVVTLLQGGIEWRGTFYSLTELRRHNGLPR